MVSIEELLVGLLEAHEQWKRKKKEESLDQALQAKARQPLREKLKTLKGEDDTKKVLGTRQQKKG